MNLDIMKERYESLTVVELRAVAKARGMRGISALRKEDLIIRMLEEDKKEANQEEQEKTETAAAKPGGPRFVPRHPQGAPGHPVCIPSGVYVPAYHSSHKKQ